MFTQITARELAEKRDGDDDSLLVDTRPEESYESWRVEDYLNRGSEAFSDTTAVGAREYTDRNPAAAAFRVGRELRNLVSGRDADFSQVYDPTKPATTGERVMENALIGAGELFNAPGIASDLKEIGETGAYVAGPAGRGNIDEVQRRAGEAAGQGALLGSRFALAAESNPVAVGSQLTGSLAGGYGAVRGARAVGGTRGSMAARYAIQPGEEAVRAVGRGVYRGGRRVQRGGTPNLRDLRVDAAGRVRDAGGRFVSNDVVQRAVDNARRFARDDRAQVGAGRSRSSAGRQRSSGRRTQSGSSRRSTGNPEVDEALRLMQESNNRIARNARNPRNDPRPGSPGRRIGREGRSNAPSRRYRESDPEPEAQPGDFQETGRSESQGSELDPRDLRNRDVPQRRSDESEATPGAVGVEPGQESAGPVGRLIEGAEARIEQAQQMFLDGDSNVRGVKEDLELSERAADSEVQGLLDVVEETEVRLDEALDTGLDVETEVGIDELIEEIPDIDTIPDTDLRIEEDVFELPEIETDVRVDTEMDRILETPTEVPPEFRDPREPTLREPTLREPVDRIPRDPDFERKDEPDIEAKLARLGRLFSDEFENPVASVEDVAGDVGDLPEVDFGGVDADLDAAMEVEF
ncbi:hypothetical protein [Haloprofundus halobius]|uniref:hypothetical protein n=1 Tax=Haloprofundus halobius TaxID=2876194 RepID=UPI001CD01F69|nr:hypothetical protein [Haloprofundus halobius]